MKVVFRKVWILLNISIHYHFFISHIVFKLSAFEVRLQKLPSGLAELTVVHYVNPSNTTINEVND